MYGGRTPCAKTLGVLSSYASASGVLLSPPYHSTISEIDLATIEHRKVMLSHEAQCDGIVAVGHDAVICDALTCLEMLNTHTLPFF